MTKNEFLDIVNDIDDVFLKELIEESEKPQENYFSDEQPQKVYLTDKPVPFWKIAVSTAAAVFVLTVGIFTTAKLRGSQPTMPNDSATENSSYSQTETSTESNKFNAVLTDGIEFSYLTPNSAYRSDPVEKSDDENYAVVYVYCRNISEENPLFIAVEKYHDGNPVYIGTLYVTDNSPRTYRIDYEEEVKRGDKLFLYICAKTDEIVRADGNWLP